MKVFYFNSIAMDDKKKYNKALERARVYRDNARAVGDYSAVARYENIFPELRESEDERIRQYLIEWVSISDNPRKKECLSWLEKQKEHHIPWYDYQKSKEAGYTIVPNEEYEQLIKQKEQKPDWSEEDEKMRNLAIEWAETMYGRFRFVDMGSTDFRKIVAWLKSLRPSWKPSEDQMDALKELIDDANRSGWVTPGATELYEQLKKL